MWENVNKNNKNVLKDYTWKIIDVKLAIIVVYHAMAEKQKIALFAIL